MVFSSLLASESMVGVDIGTNSIKIVRAEASKHGYLITHVALCPTPPESVKEGVIVDVPEVAAAIQFAMHSAGIKAQSGVAAIAGPSVLVRHVQMPTMTEQVLRKCIHFEAGKFISASIDDSVVEFEILGEGDEIGQMKVMLVAAPRAMIESRSSTLEQAGLDPVAVDVEAFATFRTLVEHNPDHSLMESTVALLDIGANHTEINLVSKGNLMLTRTVPIGGVSLTNAIKSAENCSEEDAEQRKYAVDLTELVGSTPGSTADPSLRVLQSLIDEMLREIRRSINFFQSQLPDAASDVNIERIILTGGTSRLKGLADYTQSRLNVDVSIGNPALVDLVSAASSDSPVNEEDLPLLSVAFGLAMKQARVPDCIRQAA